MAKKITKVQKVAKETGVDEKKLDRLPLDALEILDEMTPDEDDLLGDAPSQEVDPVVVVQVKEVDEGVEIYRNSPPITEGTIFKDKILLGNHPITGKPVYF